MIIQCDHCSAKFKMDDSKLANGPVKVRCAKCKEVFVVRKEEPALESVVAPAPETPPAEAAGFPAPVPVPAPESDASGFDFNDAGFSFDQEPPAGKEDLPAEQPEASNEFDWQSSPISFDAAPEKEEFDLSAFESSIASSKDSESTQGEIPDSSGFNFDDMGMQDPSDKLQAETPSADFNFDDMGMPDASARSPELETPPSAQDDFSLDFGEVSFSNPHSAPEETSESSSGSIDGGFTINPEQPPQMPESSSSDDFVISFNSDAPARDSVQDAKTEGMEGVNFGDFSFGEMEPPEAAADLKVKPVEPPHADTVSMSVPAGFGSDMQDEELPPSSLSSRKKSGSHFPLLVIFGSIILIIALGGVGVYFYSGPKAFTSVGLGFLVDWYGDKGKEEGSISLKNVTASYATNGTAGELFIVRGEAVNNYKKPRASIQVKVSVVGTAGAVLVSKSAYSGNSLSAEQLSALPMAKIDEVMNNQFGDSLANLGIKPGSSIPFVVVVSSVPKDATDYTVQVSGSTVATP